MFPSIISSPFALKINFTYDEILGFVFFVSQRFIQVFHFDYELFKGNISGKSGAGLDFRHTDWGPAPRWVAFVDFFLAAHAKHAVVSGAHRRVGTTFAQLIAALAAAHQPGTLLPSIPRALYIGFVGEIFFRNKLSKRDILASLPHDLATFLFSFHLLPLHNHFKNP